MKTRCTNPKTWNYSNYGGRGIKVCEEWNKSFDRFLACMGPKPSSRHSIDRIDNNGNYCPENCRWATAKEQGRNRRINTAVTYKGETRTVAEWSERLGMNVVTLRSRLVILKWSVHDAFTRPIAKSRWNHLRYRPPAI